MKGKALTVTGFIAAALAATVATANLIPPKVFTPLEIDQDKNVSMDFKNADAQDVFDWLKKSGVNYVVETGSIPKGKKLTVNIKGRKIGEAVEAIAEALGMGVTKKGETYVLHPGSGWAAYTLGDGKAFSVPQLGKDGAKGWQISPRDLSQDWEKWSKEFKDSFKDLPKTEWDEKEWEKFSKELKDSLKDIPQWKEMPDGGKFTLKNVPPMKWQFKGLDGKEFKGLKEWKELKDLHLPEMHFGDLGKLVESLTPEQLEKNKSKGYLTIDDLTAEQRKMLGSFDGDGDFTVKFEKDGKSVTIKRK